MSKSIKKLVIISMIAAVYTAISLALAPLSFGNIQIRIAEALVILPLIYFPSVYGVILGCYLTNLIGAIMGVNLLGFIDVFVGTMATAISAYLTYRFRNVRIKNIPILSLMMPVIFNGIVVGIELGIVLFPQNILLGSLISGIEVAIGELIAVILGLFLTNSLAKTKIFD